jgi:hypothetical protein
MKSNINTQQYWNRRFGSGDWADKGGYTQTRQFAEAQVSYFNLPREFLGGLCDFGCGAGDAFPVYRESFPEAVLYGVDFSEDAIRLCCARYGHMATFVSGNAGAVPHVDAIVCSNVLEHVDDDCTIVEDLLNRCRRLFVIVPYRERHLVSEHVRTYTENSFAQFSPVRKKVFLARGWSAFGRELWIGVYLKNIARWLVGRPLRYQNKQILFEFEGRLSDGAPSDASSSEQGIR